MTSSTNRRGFTLIELLVVAVLGGFIVLATYQVLITNSRTYAANNAQIMGQQSLRAGLDVLFGELREISTSGGDLVAMETDSITFRANRAFGIVCDTVDYSLSPPQFTAFRIGPAFQAGDSVIVFADNNTSRSADDVWLERQAQSVDATAACGTDPGQLMKVPNLGSSGDTVRTGAVIRGFEVFTYGLYQISGESYLGRRARGASNPDPLVGPLLPARGVTFRYLDSVGGVTTTNTDVAQIEVTLRYQSQVRDSNNRLVSDSIVARVYPRN